MKIIRLQASGIKRLVAVDITPGAGLNRVGGFNGEGKTSLMDTIAMAFGGADEIPMKPLRTGEEYGVVRAFAGTDQEVELIVTRYFNDDGTTSLKVTNGDGASYDKAQTKLSSVIGAISFDPLRFADMEAKAQAAELRRLVPLEVDLDALSAKDKADTLARRDVNRDAKAILPRINAIALPDTLPARPDRDAIVAALGSAGETNAAIERERGRRSNMERERENMLATAEQDRGRAAEIRKEIEALLIRIETLKAAAEGKDADAVEMVGLAEARAAEIAALPPLDEPVDTAKLSANLEEADKALRIHRAAEDRKVLQAEFDALEVKSKAFTKAMSDRAELRAKALAEAKMPVEGLSIARMCDAIPGETSEELIVTYEGEPFSQSSRAQQIRVSMRIAMAANPKLRVMTIRDASLLDERGFALISEIAAEGDYQVFAEVVGEGEENGIIIEDGRVKGAPEPERVEPPKRRKAKAEPGEAVKSEELSGNRGDRVIVDDPHYTPDRIAAEYQKAPTPREDAPKPERRKPAAMREFNSKPLGGDLFGGDK